MIVGEYGNSIERHIARHYSGFRRLDKTQRKRLVDATVRYAFRFMQATEYKKFFEQTVGHRVRVIELRRTLLADGYVMKNLKLYLYYQYVNNRQVARDIQGAFGIKVRDRNLYGDLLPETRRHFAALKRSGHKAMTVYGFDQVCLSALEQVHAFTRKFVNRKMKFIMSSHSQETHDIAAHLELDGLQAVMFYYPAIDTMEHLLNIMKRTIHNSGINYIEKFTTEKRGRIGKEADGTFVAKVLPIHSTSVLTELATVENGTLIDGSREDTFSLRLTVEKLLSKFNDKRQDFLQLLMGNYSESFTAYLKEIGATTLDNDVYWDRLNDLTEYIEYALGYLGVKTSAGDRFLKHLQSVLKDFREVV